MWLPSRAPVSSGPGQRAPVHRQHRIDADLAIGGRRTLAQASAQPAIMSFSFILVPLPSVGRFQVDAQRTGEPIRAQTELMSPLPVSISTRSAFTL
jgi:hypothetical protein